MTDYKMRAYHRAFGAHSNIPPCCIQFFIYEWDMSEGWQNEGNWYHQAVDAAKFGYVPCPRCLGTNNIVEIKLCERDCGGDHRDDFMPDGLSKRNVDAH